MSKTLSVIASCTSSSQGRRSKQEDAICCHRVVISDGCGFETGKNVEKADPFNKERSFLLAGVFDGHGGAEVATRASNLLEHAVLRAWGHQSSQQHVSGSKEQNRCNFEECLDDGAFIGDVLRRAIISLDFSLFDESLISQESSSQPENKRRRRRNHISGEGDEDPCDMYFGEEKEHNTVGVGDLESREVEVSRSSVHHDRTAAEENEDDYSFSAHNKNQTSQNTRFLRNLLDAYDSEDEWDGSPHGGHSPSELQLSKTVVGHLRGVEREPFSIALSHETGTDTINFLTEVSVTGAETNNASDQTCEAPLSALISPNSCEGNARRNLALFCDSGDNLCDASKCEPASMDVCTTSRHQECNSNFSVTALPVAVFTEKITPKSFAPPQVLPPACCLSDNQGVKLHISRWGDGIPDPRCSALTSLGSSPVVPRAKHFPSFSALLPAAPCPSGQSANCSIRRVEEGKRFGGDSIFRKESNNSIDGIECRSSLFAVPRNSRFTIEALPSSSTRSPQTQNNSDFVSQRKQPKSRYDRSGTTVSATIVTEKVLINASLGDSKSIVLRLKGPPTLQACGKIRSEEPLSWIQTDAEILLDGPQHRLDNPAEKLRLGRFQNSPLFAQFCESHPEQCLRFSHNLQQSVSSNQTFSSSQCDEEGATSRSVSPLSDSLVTDGRLLGQLNVSRGLGDFSLKHIPQTLWEAGTGEKESDAATTDALKNPIGPMGNCCDVFIYSVDEVGNEHSSQKSAAFQPTMVLTLSATDGLWDAIRTPSIDTSTNTHTNYVHHELAPLLAYLESHQHFREFVVTAWEKAISHHASQKIASVSNVDVPLAAKEPRFPRIESSTDIASVHLTSPWRKDPLSLPAVLMGHSVSDDGGGGLSDTAVIGSDSHLAKRRVLPPCQCLSDSDTAYASGTCAILPSLQSLLPLNSSTKMNATLSALASTPAAANNNKLIVELHEEHPTFSSSCPTPRGDSLNGILQKIADDLVSWAVHDKSSSDNVSVVLVAADVR